MRTIPHSSKAMALLLAVALGFFSLPAFSQWTNSTHINNTNTGNVGIGAAVSASDAKLTVTGASSTWQISLKNSDAGAGNWLLGSSGNSWATGGGKFLITNTGASTDAAFMIDAAKNIGIGTTSPTRRVEVVGFPSSDTPLLIRNDFVNVISMYANSSNSAHHSGLSLYKSRGTYTAPADVLADDRLAGISAAAYIGGTYRAAATIEFYVGASPSSSSYPGNIRFMTTPTGSITRLERVRISESGNVGIGKTNPAYPLDVNGTVNATTVNAGTVSATSFLLNGVPFAGTSQWVTSGSNIYFSAGMASIGTNTAPAGYKLAVGGKIIAEEIAVKLQANWPDYVFATDYNLLPINLLGDFIQKNGHLPEVPSAADVKKDGVALGETSAVLLKKIEELTLYLLEQNKTIESLKERIVQLEEVSKK